MIIFLISFLNLLPNSGVSADHAIDTLCFYEQAVEQIRGDAAFRELGFARRPVVSSQMPSFVLLSWFFKPELAALGIPMAQDLIYPDSVVEKRPDLLRLVRSRNSRTKIFFTAISNGIFFAEVSNYKGPPDYNYRPAFGQGLVYMFRITDQKVQLMEMKKIAYN